MQAIEVSTDLRRGEYIGVARPFAVRYRYIRTVLLLGVSSLILGVFVSGTFWPSVGVGCLLAVVVYIGAIPYLWWRRIPDAGGERHYTLGPEGFTVIRPGLAITGEWTECSRAFETRRAHAIECRTVTIIIPKRSFATPEKERDFRELIRDHVGSEGALGRWR